MEALREVLARFTADMNPLKNELEKGDRKVSSFESTLKRVGGTIAAAFAVNALYDFTLGLVHTASATAKTADALGLGVVEFQEWQHAADLSGVQSEMLTMALGKMNLQLNEVSTKGTGPAAEALKVLGLEAKTAEGKLKSSGQIIEEVADAIQGMDEVERNAQLMKLFGEQGTKLVPMLKGGSAGIKAMRAEVEALGFAFDDDFARGAEAFDDNIDRLHKGVRGFVIQAIGPLLPDLIELSGELVKGAKAVIPMVRGFVRFIRETKLLQAALALLTGKGLLVGGRALIGWVKSMGGLRGIMARVLPLIWKFVAPMLILEDIFTFLSGGDSAIGDKLDEWFGKGTADAVRDSIRAVSEFLGLFKSAPNIVRQAFGDMSDDMRKELGPWGGFIGGIFANLADYFLFLIHAMDGGWTGFTGKMGALWDGLMLGLNIGWTEFKFAGLSVAASIADAFAKAWNSVLEGAQAVLVKVAEMASKIPLIGGGISKGLQGSAQGIESFKANTDNGATVSKEWDNARMALAADFDNIAARVTATSPAGQSVNQTVTNTTQVNVTVPPGTPENMARRVGGAASSGASQGSRSNLRATQDALVPSPA